MGAENADGTPAPLPLTEPPEMSMYATCEHCGSQASRSGVAYEQGEQCVVYTCVSCNAPTVLPEKHAQGAVGVVQ